MQEVPHRWRNPLVATAAVSAAAFVALALAVAGGPLPIDRSAAASLPALHAGLTGAAIDAVNLLGGALVWDSLVALLAIALWLRGKRAAAVFLVLGVLGAEAGASVAKLVVGRDRPAGVSVMDLIRQATYPSGHVTRSVVTAGLLVAIGWRDSRRRAIGIALAVVFVTWMGIARIAVGEHWLTDVLGAVLFGISVLAVLGLVVEFVAPRLGALARPPRGP